MDIEIDLYDKKKIQKENLQSLIKKRGEGERNEVTTSQGITEIAIDLLDDNPFQPRLAYDDENLLELAMSIKEHGLLQPISVYPIGNRYIIKFGHRRVIACKKLGLSHITAIVTKNGDEEELRALSIIENLQREQMHIIDTSLALKSAMDSGKYKSIAALARDIGKDRTYVSKTLSILTLPKKIIDDLIKNKTVNDRTVLNELCRVKDEQKCEEIYFWYLQSKGDRLGLRQKVKEALEVEQGGEVKPYEIKQTPKGFTIRLPKLKKSQIEEIENMIENIIKNGRTV